jgi:hypothetical protein
MVVNLSDLGPRNLHLLIRKILCVPFKLFFLCIHLSSFRVLVTAGFFVFNDTSTSVVTNAVQG